MEQHRLKKALLIKEANLKKIPYKLIKYNKFDYSILSNVPYLLRAGVRHKWESFNDAIIMLDTETSKEHENAYDDKTGKVIPVANYIVAWTISIRVFNRNVVTLYGTRPDECIECINLIHTSMNGSKTIIYIHNLSYDYVFLKQFLMDKFGIPYRMLATKSHYPIFFEWENGIILKDSLILSQRKLERWANDLDVEHKKAVGCWDYSKTRHQGENFTLSELKYIENDTLAGVECIQATMDTIGKRIHTLPYTATGIPREQVLKRANENNYRDKFLRIAPTFEQYIKLTICYHGGYTHANRFWINQTLDKTIFTPLDNGAIGQCYDFISSYTYVMLSEKYPSEPFRLIQNHTVDWVLEHSKEYAFIFKLVLHNVRLKDKINPMPSLQYSKLVTETNPILDNGRVLCDSGICAIYLTSVDLEVIAEQYTWDVAECQELEMSKLDYLPRWFTDYAFEKYIDKCKLKDGDPVLYALSKSIVNALYGLTVMRSVRDTLEEDYSTGEYYKKPKDMMEEYEKYINNRRSVLPYFIGVFVTSYAFRNLFTLGQCCEEWLYSDTDSCFGHNWDMNKLESYNELCKGKLKANNYGAVIVNDKEYWLGVADLDKEFSEFRTQGSKRYSYRDTHTNELKITVAGVPKKNGAKALENDINKFDRGFVFKGEITGKLQHSYVFNNMIYTNSHGDLVADYVDLTACDYTLDTTEVINIDYLFNEEIELEVYE